MDLKKFVDALEDNEVFALNVILYTRLDEIAKSRMRPLNQHEMQMVRNGMWINAMKNYRERLSANLLEAKNAVYAYRNQWNREQAEAIVNQVLEINGDR